MNADEGLQRLKRLSSGTEIAHRDGVAWWDAPIPSKWHRCTPQTFGWFQYFTWVDRCACGAIRRDRGRWMQRNSRRNEQENGS